MKKILKTIGGIVLVLVFLACTLLGYLTIDEYKPAAIARADLTGNIGKVIETGQEYSALTWNIGYGALGDNADFFMDGGKMVYTASKKRVRQNLLGMAKKIDVLNPDILLLQEADRNSSRSYFIDELEDMADNGSAEVWDYQMAFAPNYKVSYVPVPIPPIGRVYAGLGVFSTFEISDANRIALPCPFSWPLRTFNLKRCLLELRFPVEGTDKEFVIFDLHLEAYDSGEGKIAQTNMLKELLAKEIDKGNYVIAAGDFNQVFSNIDTSKYPALNGLWQPGTIDIEEFDKRLSFIYDATYPTCRSLDRILDNVTEKDPQHFQYYMVDGFIVSDNIEVHDVATIDGEFKYSDHNPVQMKFSLKNN